MGNRLGVRFVEVDESTEEVIKEWHTNKDWDLLWLEPYTIDYPGVIKKIITIPGRYAPLDLSEAISGFISFETRKVELRFDQKDEDYYLYEKKKEIVASAIHGKKMRIYLDTDSHHFYQGRLEMAAEKNQKSDSEITLTGEVDPYKYNDETSMDDWLWDPFDFEQGVIGYAKDIYINGSGRVELLPTMIPVAPKIITSAALTVKFEGKTYNVPKSPATNPFQDPYMILKNNTNIFDITGTGTISFDYRGGVL